MGRRALCLPRSLFLLANIFSKPLLSAGFAPIPMIRCHVRVVYERNHAAAASAIGRLEFRRIFELLEIVLVCSIPDENLRPEGLPTGKAIFPASFMAFRVVIRAQGVMVMVSIAAVAGIGEENIFVRIVTNPVSAAIRFREVFRFAAKSAPGLLAKFRLFCAGRNRFFHLQRRSFHEICWAKPMSPLCRQSRAQIRQRP